MTLYLPYLFPCLSIIASLIFSLWPLNANAEPGNIERLVEFGDHAEFDKKPILDQNGLRIAKSIAKYAYQDDVYYVINKMGLSEQNIFVKGTEYYQAYNENEIKADKTYLNKSLIVKGLVQSISKDAFGNPYLALNGGGYLKNTIANFSNTKENIEYLMSVKKKQILSLHCFGGGLILLNAVLKDCEPLEVYKRRQTTELVNTIGSINQEKLVLSASILYARRDYYVKNITEGSLYILTAFSIQNSNPITCDEVSIDCLKRAKESLSLINEKGNEENSIIDKNKEDRIKKALDTF